VEDAEVEEEAGERLRIPLKMRMGVRGGGWEEYRGSVGLERKEVYRGRRVSVDDSGDVSLSWKDMMDVRLMLFHRLVDGLMQSDRSKARCEVLLAIRKFLS